MQADNNPLADTKYRNSELINRYRCFLQEGALSIPLFIGWFFSPRNTGSSVLFIVAWFVISVITGIACYLGNLARRECGDLRFVCYSLYKKYPAWLNWIFVLLCVAVLVKPFFALCVYIAAGTAFYRGYTFKGMEKKAWSNLMIDVLIRIAGGIVLGRI